MFTRRTPVKGAHWNNMPFWRSKDFWSDKHTEQNRKGKKLPGNEKESRTSEPRMALGTRLACELSDQALLLALGLVRQARTKMLRRQARLRREYLYKKSQEEQERRTYERKKRLKAALEEGKPIPTELRKDEAELRKAIEFDDEKHERVTRHIDDEYAWAGVSDPKIMITTSHSPSSRLKQFAKEVRLIFPNSQRLNRGNYVMSQLVNACRANEVTDLVIVHEHRGEPDGLIVSHLPFGPTAHFTLSNTVMRHDIPNIGTMSEVYPHLIFNNFKSKLGERVRDILKYLFPVPKEDSRRVVTFSNQDDSISFRHHTYKKVDGKIELTEIGPRFEMKVYEIKLGTVDQAEADVEWRLRPYMNTAKKRKSLSV